MAQRSTQRQESTRCCRRSHRPRGWCRWRTRWPNSAGCAESQRAERPRTSTRQCGVRCWIADH